MCRLRFVYAVSFYIKFIFRLNKFTACMYVVNSYLRCRLEDGQLQDLTV